MATILVVDDLEANRKFLVTLLSYQGYDVIEATDGREGLIAVRAHAPDLVIADVLMPVMDGYELVKQLRLDPATRGIPVVFATAHYGKREARELALAIGVTDVLIKPLESAAVLRVVSRTLSGGAAIGILSEPASDSVEFDREHLRLLTDQLSENVGDLRLANARLRAVINIGLELASERDPERLLHNVCVAARDLFGATYVTLGILNLDDRTVQRVVTAGSDAIAWVNTGEALAGILGTVVESRRTVRGERPGGDLAGPAFFALHPDAQAFLAAPVASPSHVYGWLCLVGNEGRTFDAEDEHLVTALSGQIGRIYENGYFSAVAQNRAAALEHEVRERRQVESALRRERDRAQQYLDTADVILLALDLDGQITLINRKGCDLLGWTEAELLGRDWTETCLPPRIRAALRERFQHMFAGVLPVVENEIVTRSGEERLIEWRNTMLRDDEGGVVGSFSSGTDITERHQAVEALRTGEERMRFALQSANVGIWDMDYATGVLQWSEILESQYGLQPGGFERTFPAFTARIHPDDRVSVIETVKAAAQSGADFSLSHRAIWPDGTVRWLNGAGRIQLGAHGEPVRGVGISLDGTGRRALEAQYQQAQKMEAIGRLAGGVAHDFNNLLTVILGYCELSLAELDPGDPRREEIVEIHKAGTSAAALTRQLLAFSRKQIIEPTLLDLNAMVIDMRPMLGRLIGEDVQVVLELGRQLEPVRADRGQLEQIVMNLAVNARDAMARGGTLKIGTTNVEITQPDPEMHLPVIPGPYVALTMSDTGTGMTPEVRARLFEPFFTTKEVGKGTGLGLASVHGIVARCGGCINVDSEVGRGTSFTVYFPRANADERADDVAPAPERRRPGTETVLVVEDAQLLRELARRLLLRLGYTVLEAANADEALRVCEQYACIDVLLADVVMPGASGPELAAQLVAKRPELKVIYMSGYTEDAIVQHGVLQPGIAFLHKPFTSDTLGRKVAEVLGR